MIKAPWSFNLSKTTPPMMQCNNPEDLNIQQFLKMGEEQGQIWIPIIQTHMNFQNISWKSYQHFVIQWWEQNRWLQFMNKSKWKGNLMPVYSLSIFYLHTVCNTHYGTWILLPREWISLLELPISQAWHFVLKTRTKTNIAHKQIPYSSGTEGRKRSLNQNNATRISS